MAKSRDRTEDFREATHATALSFGYDEAKLVALLASFILREKPPFEKAVIKTLESISELEHFITKHRKDYVDLHRITEQERDNIEHEVLDPTMRPSIKSFKRLRIELYYY
ncbi:syntaxin-81-like [Zingiber officinale]|uniref:syntaxin-81-like n=1 Tax=Zingiber officinale TaxID=94328 RepID=UPI001C4C7D19|nr:syntaxin-81-like [Zingiber officinale]